MWEFGWSTGCQLVYDIGVSGHEYILFYHFAIRFSFACGVESLCIRTFVRSDDVVVEDGGSDGGCRVDVGEGG